MKRFQNEKGFTLLETLFSIVIFLIIVSISTSSFKGFVHKNQKNESLNQLEFDNFIKEVQKEANQSISQTIYSEMLVLDNKFNVPISYRKYATLVRRQKLNTGHEIVLQNINSIYFKRIRNQQILVKVVDHNGKSYEKNIRLFNDENN